MSLGFFFICSDARWVCVLFLNNVLIHIHTWKQWSMYLLLAGEKRLSGEAGRGRQRWESIGKDEE